MRTRSRRRGIICAVLAVAITAGLPAAAAAQAATAADTAAVLAVVQRLFDAMAKRDTALARTLLLPGSRIVSLRAASGGQPRQQSDTAFLRSLATGTERLLERMWNPVVSIHGSLANVWTPYDFHIGDRFSHCGVDNFVLVRSGNAWQLVSVTYTVETAGCAPSPLGPPK